jgi:DNA replication protein DnaC
MSTNMISVSMTNSSAPSPQASPYQSLSLHLKRLRLPHMLNYWETLEHQAMQEQWSYAQFLLALCELEVDRRWSLRLKRALQEAQLPVAKTVSNFEWDHLPNLNPAPLMQLSTDTAWLERAENCLIFGPSGVGKTHLAAAVARAVVELGKRAKFFTATTLVQQLQQAKQQLQLPASLKKLDRYDLLVIDDLGYVKKSEAETSVLFELIAHRYERHSLLVTANQPFSQWNAIFADDMMTVAAVDRLVHHALIVEIQTDSYRKRAAATRSAQSTSQKTTP